MGFRTGQRLGKYRIRRRLANGGFAEVYHAFDTVEGLNVALKIPHANMVSPDLLEDFKKEVRLSASLDHPNILPLKNAQFIDGHFTIAFPLGTGSLSERMQRRMSFDTRVELAGQVLEAVAFAHERRVIHCDIKPDNLILFKDKRLRLTDFGIARLALRTVRASGSGSGTLGYVAPEQAMGRASFRSDVFSLGLTLYRLFSGVLPEWPFRWPMQGADRLRARVHPDLIAFLRKATQVEERKRFRDAIAMRTAFRELERQKRLLKPSLARALKKAGKKATRRR